MIDTKDVSKKKIKRKKKPNLKNIIFLFQEIDNRWLKNMQWIIYDESTKTFFDFLKDNLTKENILTEEELTE